MFKLIFLRFPQPSSVQQTPRGPVHVQLGPLEIREGVSQICADIVQTPRVL